MEPASCTASRRSSPALTEGWRQPVDDTDESVDETEGIAGAIGLALLEGANGQGHLVCHVREAEDPLATGIREGVEGGRLHLDGENSLIATTGDGRCRLAKGCVCRPGAAALDRQAVGDERSRRRVEEG
jgi:hypothetical protein